MRSKHLDCPIEWCSTGEHGEYGQPPHEWIHAGEHDVLAEGVTGMLWQHAEDVSPIYMVLLEGTLELDTDDLEQIATQFEGAAQRLRQRAHDLEVIMA